MGNFSEQVWGDSPERRQVYAGRPSSPDHAYFQRVKTRLDGQLALLSMARKLARRCHHTPAVAGPVAGPRSRSNNARRGAEPTRRRA